MLSRLRTYFFAGLIVVLPVAVTLWLFWFLAGLFDGWILPLIPEILQPATLISALLGFLGFEQSESKPFALPGLGIIVFLLVNILIGWLTMGFIGRTLMRWIEENFVEKMPIVRSVYNSMKQIVGAAIAQKENTFEKACLVEYPRKNSWAIAFISSNAAGEIDKQLPADDIISVFVPTTPNPTSGFLLFIPKSDVIILDMSIEDAAKLVISAGIVYPNAALSNAALSNAAPPNHTPPHEPHQPK